jgi:hypothetical protein
VGRQGVVSDESVGWAWSGMREHRVVVSQGGGSWGEDMLGSAFSGYRKKI